MCLAGAGAVVYVFSTTDRESFLEIERWKGKVEAECGSICQVLVQNKIDLLEKAQVQPAEVEDLSRRMGVKLYRTCVKDNVLVDDVFDYLADSFLKAGGEHALGVESVISIGDVGAAAPSGGSGGASAAGGAAGAASSSSANAGSNGAGGASGAANGGGGSDANKPANAPSASFQLAPLTVRTDGKKKSFCTIL